MLNLILRNLALILVYGLTGWLALQVAVPPGYAAPIFPPAGIALAAILSYGYGLAPAVLLGSISVVMAAAWQTGAASLSGAQALIAALGPTLQAVVGAAMTRRLVHAPLNFESLRSIVLLMVVVAPLSCLIAATLSVPYLVSVGVIPPVDAWFSWWTWWIGDTLGVVTLTPLALTLIGQPRSIWAPRLRSVAWPLVVALFLVGGVFVQMRDWEQRRVEAQFAKDAGNIASLIQKRLDVQIDLVLAMDRFVSASQEVTREEWREFVSPWLTRYPGTLNFSWAPLVTHAARPDFEAGMQRNLHAHFEIVDRTVGGQIFPAQTAPEYLPYIYVEPMAGNASALGLNPLSLPTAREALEQTRLNGRPAASGPMRLVQDREPTIGVVLYQAVFGEAPGSQTRSLRGVVSSAFRVSEAVAASLAHLSLGGLEICLLDLNAPAGGQRLLGPSGCENLAWLGNDQRLAQGYEFGGRQWQILLRASDAYRNSNRSWAMWTMLAGGLACCGMLSVFLLLNSGRTRHITELVVARTAELAAANSRLREQRSALSEAQRMARMGSWSMVDGVHLECSEELLRILALSGSAPITVTRFLERLERDDRDRLLEALDQAHQTPSVTTLDCTFANPDGSPDVLHFQIESSAESGVMRVRGTVQNVTAARQAEAHIHYLARFDSLTGLPNRLHWLDHARETLAEAQRHKDPVAVLFLDVDNFKTVNDSLGHPIGDRLLAAMVTRLANCLRSVDLLARLGGDEFVVLISRFHHREDVARVAAKLIQSLKEPIQVDRHDLVVGVSIGIALFPEDGADVDTLLKNADVAMYGAKHAGRNAYQFFEPQMNEHAVRRLELEHDLRQALERNELVLHFQPQIHLATGRPMGCEALVRWQHPVRGWVPPDQFIPVAEASGLILPLGDWVLSEACRQQSRLSAMGMQLRIAVNISALQFRRADFADRVARVLRETGADPHLIELEITESALMEPDEAMLERLARIRTLGVTLALDDFGTGYSSLAYLRRLPIQILKIDRSFVRDLPGDPEDAAIASATLSLARDLGLAVVAEGVETQEQRDYLASRGCDLIQGYLIAKPMPEQALIPWLRAYLGQSDDAAAPVSAADPI